MNPARPSRADGNHPRTSGDGARCYPQFDFEREFPTNLSSLRLEHSSPKMLRERVVGALQRSGFGEGDI